MCSSCYGNERNNQHVKQQESQRSISPGVKYLNDHICKPLSLSTHKHPASLTAEALCCCTLARRLRLVYRNISLTAACNMIQEPRKIPVILARMPPSALGFCTTGDSAISLNVAPFCSAIACSTIFCTQGTQGTSSASFYACTAWCVSPAANPTDLQILWASAFDLVFPRRQALAHLQERSADGYKV